MTIPEHYTWQLFEHSKATWLGSPLKVMLGTYLDDAEEKFYSLAYIIQRDPTGLRNKPVLLCEMSGESFGEIVAITNGLVELEVDSLRGNGVGTLVMNPILEWAVASYPEAELQTIHLHEWNIPFYDADIRHRYYAGFNIPMKYFPSKIHQWASGESLPVKMQTLTPNYKRLENMIEKNIVDRIQDLEAENAVLAETAAGHNALNAAKNADISNLERKVAFWRWGFFAAIALCLASSVFMMHAGS